MTAFGAEERELLDKALRDFIARQYGSARRRGLAAGADGFGREEWAQYAALGWHGLGRAEEHGGSGGGATELAILMAAAGRGLLLEPLLATAVLGVGAVVRAGTAAQKARVLPKVADGSLMLAFAHTEPEAGFARGHVDVLAAPGSKGFRLVGKKTFVLHAAAAGELVVSARVTSPTGPIGLFLVPAKAAGLTVRGYPTVDGRRAGDVTFADVELPLEARLGGMDAGDQSSTLEAVLDLGALAVSAEAVGAMAAANETTLAYLKTRRQFGRALAEFQVLQHRLVDMSIAAEEARAMVGAAARAVDEGHGDVARLVAAAKVQAARSARFVGAQAIQLHGGMGMTDELEIGHYYKRLMLCEGLFGDADWWLERVG
jgi:hypothetical protein